MKVKLLILFLLSLSLVYKEASADLSFEQSCREFKELMISGNKIIFLRSDLATNTHRWKAVICLHCSESKEAELARVTNLKDGSIDWHFKEKNFLEIREILEGEDNSSTDTQGMHTLLSEIRKTCRSYLKPVNEGSHLQLVGNDSCVRHEYLRRYLERKHDLSENFYIEIESKKDLRPDEFLRSCHQTLKEASDRNILTKTLADIVIATKRFLGFGLGDYDPVVASDSKSFHRDIAAEAPLK